MTSYKTCAVPLCRSTTIACPEKLFIHVPRSPNLRKQWLALARRDPEFTSDKSTIYFCEDHFDLPNDMSNYIQYKVMGSVGNIKMKPDCFPSKFQCQPVTIELIAPPQVQPHDNKRQCLDTLNIGQEISFEPAKFGTISNIRHLKERLEFRVEVSCVKVEPSDELYSDRAVKEPSDELYADHVVKEELVLGPECIHKCDGLILHDTAAASSPVLAQHSVQQQCALTCKNNTEQKGIVLQQVDTQHVAGTSVYGCDTCGKTYKRKKFLISHIKVHMQKFSGKTPFFKKGNECDICKLKFTNLAKHKRTHTGEKPFACKTCHRTFKQSRHLEEHLQIHGEKLHSCDICLKKFAQSRTLITHRRIHTGEQPYLCKVCPKKFKQYGNLKVHERTHTGEKPFKCEVCSKAFAILSDMKRHNRVTNRTLVKYAKRSLPCHII